jgi:hypothetical protein
MTERKDLEQKKSVEPIVHWQTLNAGVLLHGKHWRASPKAHGNSVGKSSSSTGRTDAADAFTYASSISDSWKENPLPNAGIRTGEIIGHRLWYVTREFRLKSLIAYQFWSLEEIVTGDVEKYVFPGTLGGVYAFKDYDGEIAMEIAYLFLNSQWNPDKIGIAKGTVKLWGQVIEHEYGYRAQFAKIATINWARGFDESTIPVNKLIKGGKNGD